MRPFCIALGIGIILWLQEPSPMALVGLFVTGGIVGARLAIRAQLPGGVGMVAAGFLIGASPIVSPENLQTIDPFADIALAWTGLYLGTGLSRAILKNKRLLIGGLCLYALPGLTTFCALLLYGMPVQSILPLAIVAGLSAPSLFDRSDYNSSEPVPLSLLATMLGVGLAALSILPHTFTTETLVARWGINVLVWLVGIELAYRGLESVRTPTARYCSWFFMAFLLAIVSWHTEMPPLFLALISGLAISLRSKHGLRPKAGIPEGEPFIAFALAYFACTVFVTQQPHWPIPPYIVLSLTMLILGKLVGGILATRLTSQPTKAWLPTLPQGLLATACLGQISPETPLVIYFASTAILLPLMLSLANYIKPKLRNGRLRALRRRRRAA